MDNKITLYKASVGGFVVRKKNDEEEILLVKKNYGALEGKWAFPGGFIRSGENIEKALSREVLEETGIEILIKNPIGFRVMSAKKEESTYFLFHALTKNHKLEPRKSSESFDTKFFSLEEVEKEKDISSLIKETVKTYYLEGVLKKTDFLPEEIKTNSTDYNFYLVS